MVFASLLLLTKCTVIKNALINPAMFYFLCCRGCFVLITASIAATCSLTTAIKYLHDTNEALLYTQRNVG